MADSRRQNAIETPPGSTGLNGGTMAATAAQTISPPRQKGRFLIVEPPKVEDDELTESSASPSTSPATYANLTSPEIQSRFAKATTSPTKATTKAPTGHPGTRDGADTSFGSAPGSTGSAPRSGPARNQTSAALDDSSSSTSSSHGPSSTPFVVKNTEGALFDPAMAAAYGWNEDDSSASETSESSTATSYTSASTSRSRSSSTKASSSSLTQPPQQPLHTLLPPMSAYGSGQLPTRERERMRREWLANIMAHRTEQERLHVEKERAAVERKRALEQRAQEAAAQAQEAAEALAAAVEAVARAQAQARALLLAREQVNHDGHSLPVLSSATFVDTARTRSTNSASVLQSSPRSPRSPRSPPHAGSAPSITSPGSPNGSPSQRSTPTPSAASSRPIQLELDLTAANASRKSQAPISPKAAVELPVLDLATYQAKRLSVEPSSHGLTSLPPPTPHGDRVELSSSAGAEPSAAALRGENLTPPPYSVSAIDAEKRSGHRRSASDTITLEARMQVRRDSGPPPPRPTNEKSPRSGSKSSSLGKHGTATASKKALEMTVWTEPSLSSSSLSEADSTASTDVVDLSHSAGSLHVHGTASPTTPKRVRIQDRPATDLKTRGRSASVSKRIGNFIGRIFDSKTAKEKEGVEKEKSKKSGKLRRSNSSMSSSSTTHSANHQHGASSIGEESLESSQSSGAIGGGGGSASPPHSINSLASSHSSESIHRTSSELNASSHLPLAAPSTSAPSAPSVLDSPTPPPPGITTTDDSGVSTTVTSPPPASTGKASRPKPPVPPKPSSVILRSQTLRPSTTTKKEFGLEEPK